MRRSIRNFIAALLLFAAAGQAQSSVILSGDVAAGTGVLEITSDLVFDITSNGNARVLVFDEWGDPQDGSPTSVPLAGPFTLELNGTDTGVSVDQIVDNLTYVAAAVTPNDAYMFWDADVAVIVGDTVTIKAGTWNLSSQIGFNPAVSGTFEGDLFITDEFGNQVSATIPSLAAPPALALTILGIAGMSWVRRIQPAKTACSR